MSRSAFKNDIKKFTQKTCRNAKAFRLQIYLQF